VDDAHAVRRLVELGTGSVTSNNADENGYPTDDLTGPLLRAANPNHLRFFESERHGYVLAELTPDRFVAQFRSPRTILAPTSPVDVLATVHCTSGSQRLDVVPH
jgi:hypothetical protein